MKVKKKNIIIILSILFITLLAGGINLSFYQPTSINRFISSKLYKSPANTAFVDQNFYNCVVDAYNEKNNASIAYTEILTDEQLQTITRLTCNGNHGIEEYKIKNVSGLEKLTNLYELGLSNNKIETIDLNNLKNLIRLDLTTNKLTSIDLSNSTELDALSLGENLLTTLDITNNTNLSSLSVRNTNLTEIDIRNHPNIEYLTIDNSNISSIDLTSNSKLYQFSARKCNLTSINLENNKELSNLNLAQNYLTSINLTKNINLEELDLSNNSLSEIDITNNSKLVDLNIENASWYGDDDTNNHTIEYIDFSKNTLLENLDIEGLNLKRIDLTNNKKLKTIYLRDNQLEEIIINDSIESTYLKSYSFGKQKSNQKKIILDYSKSIIPNDAIKYYINEKVIVSEEYTVETFIEKLGLTGLTAKIYNGNEEIESGKITNDHILKIYDNEEEIQNDITISILNSNIFKDEKLYQCVIDGYNSSTGESLTTAHNLTTEELLKITELDCGEYNISDFSGVEQLHNLEYLLLDEQEHLKKIDISYMTNLKEFSAPDCSLEKLDTSNNPKLEYIDVYNNYISELDLSKNPELMWLEASVNYITTLDLSNNKKLEVLYMADNGLKNIDLSNNTELIELLLYNNNLTEIDVTKNKKIDYLSISNGEPNETNKKTIEAKNNISNIDLSNNEELVLLYLGENSLKEIDLSNNSKLIQIELQSNQLSDIDLSNMTELSTVFLENNNLESINLSKNIKLEQLNLENNQLNKIDLSNNKLISYLKLGSNYLTSVDITGLSELNYLYIENNDISELNLQNNPKLKTLNVSNNPLDSIDISTQTKLTELFAQNNYLETIDLNNNSNLTSLNLNNNNLTKIVLDNNSKLKYLYLNENSITEINTAPLANLEILEIENNQLTKLDLSQNINLGKYSKTSKVNGNPFALEITILEDTYTEIKSPVIFPETKKYYLKKLIYEDSKMVIENNRLMATETGDYTATIILSHNIGAGTSSEEERLFSATYNIKVLEPVTSEKYQVNSKYNYIFTDTETDSNTILNNINIPIGTKEIVDNKLLIKYNDEIINKYDIVSITSSYYDLSKEYIYLLGEEFDETKINTTFGTFENTTSSSITLVYNNMYLKTYNIISLTSEKYKILDEYIYIGNDKYDRDVLNNITVSAAGTISIDENELVIEYRNQEVDRINIYAIDFGALEVTNKKIVTTEDIAYDELISNITTMGVTYKIFSGETEITSGDIAEGMTIKVYYNDTELDTYELTNEYLDLSKLNVDEKNTLVKGLQLGSTVENTKELILTSGTITFYDKNNEVLSDTSKVTTGSKIVIELATTTYTYILSVKGDVTGTGESNVADVAKLYQYMKNKIDMEYCYVEAGNVIGDTVEIKVNDVAKLYQYIKGKIDSLEA